MRAEDVTSKSDAGDCTSSPTHSKPSELIEELRKLARMRDALSACHAFRESRGRGRASEQGQQMETALDDPIGRLYNRATDIAWQLSRCGVEKPEVLRYCAEALLFLGEEDPTDVNSVVSRLIFRQLVQSGGCEQ